MPRKTTRQRYWYTPKVWKHSCSHCGQGGAVAFRSSPRAYACESCVTELGIKPRESRAHRDGGGRAGGAVKVMFVDPATLR